eukprot:6933449-Alexandrium_andersonii.AAC.1
MPGTLGTDPRAWVRPRSKLGESGGGNHLSLNEGLSEKLSGAVFVFGGVSPYRLIRSGADSCVGVQEPYHRPG